MMRYLLLFILLIPLLVLAQSEDDSILIAGESQLLSISADARASVIFTTDDTVYVQIRAESEAFDAVVWIVDAENRLLAYDNNDAEGSNARIDNLYISPGIYTIFVDSFNGVSQGDVRLSLEIVDPFDTETELSGADIVITALLPEDLIFEHEFVAFENGVVTITVRDTSGTLDPYLSIYDESGQLIIANDDHQSPDVKLNILDSRISEWIVPVDGTYTIAIHDFSGASGRFELIISISP